MVPASLVLTDNDSATLDFGVGATTLAEADQSETTITLSITNGVTFQRAQDINISLRGTATAGADYTFTDAAGRTFTKPYVVVLPGGDSSVTGTITAVDDDREEPLETVIVSAEYRGAPIGRPRAIAITDDDDPALALTGLTIATTNSRAAYPVFDADTLHYAVGCGPGDTLTVTATAPASVRLSVNGTQMTSGTVVDITEVDGDSDVKVVLSDSGGRSRTYTIHCLPDDFPTVTVTKNPGAFEGLLLNSINLGPRRDPNSWAFLQVMDTNGVPRFHRRLGGASVSHFRPQEGGLHPYGYTIASEGQPHLVLLDEDLEVVKRVTADTWTGAPGWEDAYLDLHDFVLTPDGTSVIIIYDPLTRDLSNLGFGDYGTAAETEDEILLKVDPSGTFTKLWDSYDHMHMPDCTQHRFIGNAWSHFNSIEQLTDGHFLLSLRGCAAIVKVHSETGEVLWRIGRTTLTDAQWEARTTSPVPPYDIVGDPEGEFCGQHAAKIIGNGNLLLYDNGSHCFIDPYTGSSREELQASRVLEYSLDHDRGEARFLRQHSLGGSGSSAFTPFTGLVAPMDNGNWWVSWGGTDTPARSANVSQSVTEVNPETGEELLHLRFEDANGTRRHVRSYSLREDEFKLRPEPLTGRIVSHTDFDEDAPHQRTAVVAFNRPVVDFDANTPSIQVTGGTLTSVRPHVGPGLPANAYELTLTTEGEDETILRLVADEACAAGGICTADGDTLVQDPLTSESSVIVSPPPVSQETTEVPTGEVEWSADMLVVEYTSVSIGAASADLFSNSGGSAGLHIMWLWSYTPNQEIRLAFEEDVPNADELSLQVGDLLLKLRDAQGGGSGFVWTGVDVDWEDGQTLSVRLGRTNSLATGLPAITGTAQVGEMLTANVTGISDANGLDNAVFNYQWIRVDGGGEEDISGATSSTYTLVDDDLGKTIKLRVSFTDDAENEETLTSEATDAVVSAALNDSLWSATLTAGASGNNVGYSVFQQVGELSSTRFSLKGTDHIVRLIIHDGDTLYLRLKRKAPAGLILRIGDAEFALGDASILDLKGAPIYHWPKGSLDWSVGEKVRVSLALAVDTEAEEPTANTAPERPPTAVIEAAPDSHDGSSAFTFELRFSEEPHSGFSYRTLKFHAFDVTGGTILKSQRIVKPSNLRWLIAVEPDGNGDVTIVLPATTDCNASGAICTEDGRLLSNRLELTVSGPSP